ncbi:MAG: mitochondrial fission ELM1 family protein [Synergistaceae bacterium]|nr:mitochondrial fission ELM1 family protein [Synergistaceae bacterium]
MQGIKRVVIISDGIRGHFHQSLGVANWLERLAEVKQGEIIEVPKLTGIKKLLMTKIFVRKIAQSPEYSREWLKKSGADIDIDFKPNTLFISAGSSAAPFCLALAKSTGNKSAVIMTPSVLGTKFFDFAVIPEHDKHDSSGKNIITTLGAPNHIYRPDLKEESRKFLANIKLDRTKKIIALLIGGSDANYKLTPEWAEKIFMPLRDIKDSQILITTSRRSGAALDNMIEKIFIDSKNLAYMLLASREPEINPIPAMLGAADHVLVTEDSVSMVSESITAGFRVGLIRVPRASNFIKNLFGFGAVRFDNLFASMRDKDLLADLGASPDFASFINFPEQKHGKNFNEARRAAEWILSQS